MLDPIGLTFTSMFFWVLVSHRLSPTEADYNLTWNRAIFVAALVAYLEIDFAKLLISMIHEMDI